MTTQTASLPDLSQWAHFIALIRQLNLRHLARQRVRTALSMLGVVIGVTTFIFGPAIAVSIQDSLRLTTSDVSGKTDIEVRSTDSGFDAELLDKVKSVMGVEVAAPLSTGGGLMVGQRELLVFIGIDPAVDQRIRNYTLVQGSFLSGPTQVLLSEAYAREKGIKVGDDVRLVSAGGLRHLTVVGTLAAEGVARLNSGDIVVVGLDDALKLHGTNKIDTVSIIAARGTNPSDLITSIKSALPDIVTVDRPADRLKAAGDFMIVINMLMLIISLMVLGIGSMLIYNTMSVSVSQRRAEIGVLRALGMSRQQVIRMFTLEAATLGLAASILGVILGLVMIKIGGNLPLIPQFSSSALSSKADIVAPLWLIPIAFLAGVLISALAGYFPSRHAAMIDPVEAMIAICAESSNNKFPTRQLITALILIVILAGIRTLRFSDAMQGVMIANVGIMMSFTILLLLVAPLLMSVASILPPLMYRLLGIAGLNAALNLVRRPKRIIVTALLITVGVGGGALVSGSNFGYSKMIDTWNSLENIGDLTVAGAGNDPFSPMIPLPADVVNSLKSRTDTAALITERLVNMKHNGIDFRIRAMDITEFKKAGGGFMWNEGDTTGAFERLLSPDKPSVLVSTSVLAISNGLIAGKTVTLNTPSGPVQFAIVGSILGKVETDRVTVIMDRGLYEKLWNDNAVDRAMLTLKSGTDVQAVRRDLLRQYALSGAVTYSNQEVRDAFSKPIASISTTSGVLSLLILVTMVAGIGSTMFVQVLDRRREIGMLRAVGMLPRQIAGGILLEVLLLVILAAIIGVPSAYVMTSLQQMAMQQVMGIEFALNVNEVAYTIGILLVTGLLATFIPARSAGQTNILEAMRYE